MPLVEGRICNVSDDLKKQLITSINRNIVEVLKINFASELGFTEEKENQIAKEVIGRFAPGWVWVYLEDFNPTIAGEKIAKDEMALRMDIGLLEGSMREEYQDELVTAATEAARQILGPKCSKLHLAVANITGNVRMSVPSAPDALLRAGGVHAFLARQVQSELHKRQATSAR